MVIHFRKALILLCILHNVPPSFELRRVHLQRKLQSRFQMFPLQFHLRCSANCPNSTEAVWQIDNLQSSRLKDQKNLPSNWTCFERLPNEVKLPTNSAGRQSPCAGDNTVLDKMLDSSRHLMHLLYIITRVVSAHFQHRAATAVWNCKLRAILKGQVLSVAAVSSDTLTNRFISRLEVCPEKLYMYPLVFAPDKTTLHALKILHYILLCTRKNEAVSLVASLPPSEKFWMHISLVTRPRKWDI